MNQCPIFENRFTFFGYSLSAHLNGFKIISSERFHVDEHIFSEARLLLKQDLKTYSILL